MKQDEHTSALAESAGGLDGSAASIPSAGQWVLIRDWSVQYREIVKVMPKTIKLGAGSSKYPPQIGLSDSRILGFAGDGATAERLKNSISGADGDYQRRRQAATDERNIIIRKARDSRDSAVAKIFESVLPDPQIHGPDDAQ